MEYTPPLTLPLHKRLTFMIWTYKGISGQTLGMKLQTAAKETLLQKALCEGGVRSPLPKFESSLRCNGTCFSTLGFKVGSSPGNITVRAMLLPYVVSHECQHQRMNVHMGC